MLGSDFYVMERVRGHDPARGDPERARPRPAGLARLCRSVIDALADLHGVDPERAGLGDLGPGRGYVGRQVEGWSARYRAARTPNVPRFERVMDWLSDNRPDDVPR